MSKNFDYVRIMPKRIKNRLGIAFALMAVIPTMIGVSVLTNNVSGDLDIKWHSVAFVICIVIAAYGLVLMKSTVWSLIDISKTLNEVLKDYGKKKDGISASEIISMDKLIIYMQNQIHQSRQHLDRYRSEIISDEYFRLPPLSPPQIIPQRILTELQQAENNKYPIIIIALKFTDKLDDEIPQKLLQFLKSGNIKFDGMGRYEETLWIFWQKKQASRQGEKTEDNVEAFFGQVPGISHQIWRHPIQGYEISEIIESLERFNAGK